MNKKIVISVIIGLIIIFIIFGIWNFGEKNNEEENNNLENNITNTTTISSQYVSDDCINEWEDYSDTIEDAESASNDLSDKDTHYLIRDIDGYIIVYYIDENGDEILYKETTISTEYLSVTDLDDLEIGIEVVGLEDLNKLLEDFE